MTQAMIEHEDGLRNQRLGWLFTLNGLLFTGLSFAWGKHDAEALALVFSVFGIVINFSGAATLKVSHVAIRALRADEDPTDQAPASGRHTAAALSSSYFKENAPSADERGVWHIKWFWERIPHLYLWDVAPWALTAAWAAVLPISLVAHGGR